MINNIQKPELRMAAVLAVVLGLIAVWFMLDPLATDSPGRAAALPEAPPDDRGCLLGMRNATIDLDQDFMKALDGAGVKVSASAPAEATNGTTFSIPVRGASGVTCMARNGIIGLRGGLKFSDANKELTMRKWRIVLDDNRVETSLADGNPVPIAGLSVDLKNADRVVRGQQLSLNADAKLGDGGLAALNLTFGTTFEEGQRVGRLGIGVREIRAEPKPPPEPKPVRPKPSKPKVSLLG